MELHDHGSGWAVYVDGPVMLWEFKSGMELAAFADEAYPVYEDLLERGDFRAMVTDVQLDDPFTSEAFDLWERSAQTAVGAGIERWALVAEGIKSMSLRGRIQTGELEIHTTEDRAEAITWATTPQPQSQ